MNYQEGYYLFFNSIHDLIMQLEDLLKKGEEIVISEEKPAQPEEQPAQLKIINWPPEK